MSTTTKKRKAGAALPSKTWHTADVLKAVYMAGRGASASEIARVISGTTPDRVRAMLRVNGFGLVREKGNEDVLFVRWKREDRAMLDAAADRMDREPGELAALIVRKALADKAVEKMVDPLDVVGL